MKPSTSEPLRTGIARNWTELEAIRDEWDALVTHCDASSLFTTWEWIQAWKEVMEVPETGLLTVYVRSESGELIGLAPFYISALTFAGVHQHRCLTVLGDKETGSEYQAVLVHNKSDPHSVLARMVETLIQVQSEWDCIWLPKQADWIASNSIFIELLRTSKMKIRTRDVEFAYIPLPDSIDTFWATRSKSHRTAIRRSRNKYPANKINRCGNADEIDEGLSKLVDLHNLRWNSAGDEGAFGRHPRAAVFFQQLCHYALTKGWLRLYMLSIKNETKAVQLGFAIDGVFYVIQEGFDPQLSGIGNVLRSFIIEECILEKLTGYDFLAGYSEHNQRWGAQSRTGSATFIWNENLNSLPTAYLPTWPSGRFLRFDNPT